MTESTSVIFEWWWILFLLPLPWIYRSFRKPAESQNPALAIPVYDQLLGTGTKSFTATSKNKLNYLLLILLWITALFAAARPTWVGEPIELPTTGRDLLLCVDISESMRMDDMPLGSRTTERIVAVKVVLSQFAERRKGDRLGLILFGSLPYLQSPLTFDRQTVTRLLEEAQAGFAGNKTAIGDAIGLGVKRLIDRPENHRILILLTDGSNTYGELDPIKAAEAAAQMGVKIYTVGVGADSVLQRSLFGVQRVHNTALDEDTLQAIADKTGGRYYRARDVEELNQIYQELDKLEPIEQEAETLRPTKALYHWPLGVALFAGLLLMIRRQEATYD
ncbi:VWA domain-containing protein [Porticoccaceae bacterium LTM1]|nr:VWA domain-containing protein [Porticoccaceae bacterium LTM1]